MALPSFAKSGYAMAFHIPDVIGNGMALLPNAMELIGRAMPSNGIAKPGYTLNREGIELNCLESQR